MKYLFTALLFITTSIYAQDSEVVRLSEPVQETVAYEVFGSEMIEESANQSISLTSAISDINSEVEIFIKTRITQVCKKKGCFFIATDGETTARVSFINYSFFVPTNSLNKDVIVRGVLTEKELTVEQAQHYAEDMGENSQEINAAQMEYSIVATSVRIPKSK